MVTFRSLRVAAIAGLAVADLDGVVEPAAIQCPILLDGRVPANTPVTAFDAPNGIFNPDYVKGNNLNWSDILLAPSGLAPSRFDGSMYEPLEVTINNASVFESQYGFRRAGLLFVDDTGNSSSDYGVVTLHWSVKQDMQRPLNLSHEYLNVWHETEDFSADQVQFNTGTRIGSDGSDKTDWQLLDRNSTLLWADPIDFEEWQNFAVTIDYDAKEGRPDRRIPKRSADMLPSTLTAYASIGNASLRKAAGPFWNDNSGLGQFQIGILKKPTGTTDVVYAGFQEAPFEEGQIYGGMFVEDSGGGCVSL